MLGSVSHISGVTSSMRSRATVVAMASASSQHQRVALVTGANKGIGKEIARKLLTLDATTVILGCRSKALGEKAVKELMGSGDGKVIFSQLDLEDAGTIARTSELIQKEFGHLDILVNNAAICFNDPTLYGKVAHTPFQQQADITVRTNFFGTLAVTQAMLPLLKASTSPRIVNVASAAGRLSILRSQDKVDIFTSEALDLNTLEALMKQFVVDVESGVHERAGWPNTCYGMSKLGLIALTKLLAREQPEMMVNSVDPGYCATDQNRNQGSLSAEWGSRTPVMLATIPEGKFLSGGHFYDGREISWWYR